MFKVALVYHLEMMNFLGEVENWGTRKKWIQHPLHESHKTTFSLTADSPFFFPVGC